MHGGCSDFDASSLRRLTPQQWADLKRRVVARAHEERSQVTRQMLGAMLRFTRRIRQAAHWLPDAPARHEKLPTRAN